MAPDPPTSGSKMGIRNYPRRMFSKLTGLLRLSLKPASQQSLSTSNQGTNPLSLTPPIDSRHAARGYPHSFSSIQAPAQQAPISPHDASLCRFPPSTPEVTNKPDKHTTCTTEGIQPDLNEQDRSRSQPFGSTILEVALRALRKSAKVIPPLQPVVDGLISCLELVEEAAKHRQACGDLTSDIRNLNELLVRRSYELESTSMSDCVLNVVKSLSEEVQQLSKKGEQRFAMGVMRAGVNADELAWCVSRIQALLRGLEVDVNLSMWSIANENQANTRLEALSPVKVAGYNSALPEDAGILRRKCTHGTRTDILSGLNSWSNNPKGAKMYWMNGMAGTGKTTIACSLSAALAKRKQLGASFFCTRALPQCRDARRIVPTVAYQLARYSRPFQAALCKALESNPDIATELIETQFERLLREPLLAIKDAMPVNVVIVIDALDECSDSKGVETFLNELFKFSEDLTVKVFITSRPEPGISDNILLQSNNSRSVLHLHEVGLLLVQADIELYLKEELAPISASETQIKRLAQLAGCLFIYAATAVRYILPGDHNTLVNSQERLQVVLSMKHESIKQYDELDALYRAILTRVFHKNSLEAAELERGKLVLWTAACACEPVTVGMLASLSDQHKADTLAILQSLRSVLYISESSGLVSALHASFLEFIFTRERSQEFFCDEKSHSLLLARQCFGVMKTELRFNICRLESSFVLDESVEDLEARVNKYISQFLSYGCKYWADHLSAAGPSENLCVVLEEFLSTQLLFWMEVLNLTKSNSICILQKVHPWLLVGKPTKNMEAGELTEWGLKDCGASSHQVRLVSEAITFVTAFSANRMSLSTPHIYISALPFFCRSIPLLMRYRKHTQGLIGVEGTAVEQLGTASLASWNTGLVINSIAMSADGSLIAFGGSNKEGATTGGSGQIGIINRYNGQYIVGPFKGHGDSVRSVAFSTDGMRIVSGAADKTICIWSTKDGTLLAGPFRGHTKWVRSVAFSPDGTRIVSGSDDSTIRMWDSQDGKLVTGPLKGHYNSVLSVSFSHDGTRVVSGSFDRTICVWGAEGGKLIAGPFKGHTNVVCSVSFSPDDTHIVSGSWDKTICVWNAHDGTLAAGPFKGHADFVRSVAFSPDGMRVVSGSQDKTIRVWDVRDGKLVAGPFEGHSCKINTVAFSADGICVVSGSSDRAICVWNAQDSSSAASLFNGRIRSVAFSPSGTYIASGSENNTICVWDAQDGKLVTGPLRGHSNHVRSVAFSPDGTRIVSGSEDMTICLWNAQDGHLMAKPLKGHSGVVTSVAFSPDGTRIVSGSDDKTVCVWNVQDGGRAAGPFQAHTNSVRSVGFSPDGIRVVSGSDDRTICVWNAKDGSRIIGPFNAHEDIVMSVTFSPDGARIVSGSVDETICVWDAQDGKPIAGPFKGHSNYVRSVALSPDGTHIVSGSGDMTICVWDSRDGRLVAGPFKGHTDLVNSVAFSPDGTRIVSGSHDCSLRVTSFQKAAVPVPALDGEWEVQPSGWVVNRAGQHLFWVPKCLHSSLPRPYESLAIGPHGGLRVDYSNVLLGDNWSQCYVGG